MDKHNASNDETDFQVQYSEMLQLLKSIYLTDNPDYKCGVKRNLTMTYLLTINEINEKINSDEDLFNLNVYLTELNKVSDKKIEPSNTKIIISGFILKWLKDMFSGLQQNLSQLQFQRAFRNVIHYHSIFQIMKPIELLVSPHYHLRLPVKYYQAFFLYESIATNNKNLALEKLKDLFKLDTKKNCAYSTYNEFSATNSIEQLELQFFFLTKKFDMKNKDYTKLMVKNLIETSIEIVERQSWIDKVTKISIRESIQHIQKQIAYSDLIDESVSAKKLNKELTNGQSDYFILTKYKILLYIFMKPL